MTRLTLPPELAGRGAHLVARFQQTGYAGVLGRLTGRVVVRDRISNVALWHDELAAMDGHAVSQIDVLPLTVAYRGTLLGAEFSRAGPVVQRLTRSPVPARWPLAVTVSPRPAMAATWSVFGEPFRTVRMGPHTNLTIQPIGAYNPAHLRVADDPLTHLPLVGYRPESGRLVLNAHDQALNPPRAVRADGSPAGLWTAPPEAMTTLGAAAPLLGPAPISSIRVRVAHVGAIGAGGTRRLTQVAHAITHATGLPVEVVRGASPEQILIHPGALPGFRPVGWIETDWVRLGASTEILREALLNQAVTLAPVLVAAALFAGITAWLGLASTRREWAVAAAVGVTPRRIFWRLMARIGLYGVVVVAVAVLTAGLVGGSASLRLSLPIGLGSGLVVALAMVPSARATAHQDPVVGLRPTPLAGVLSLPLGRPSLLGLALAGATAARLVVAGLALLVPAATAYAVLFMQGVWRGTLHVTVLGQYLLLNGSWLMTMGLGATLVLTGLAATEIAVTNAEARRKTWATGAALGWPAHVALTTACVELGVVGAAAGLVGGGVAGWALHAALGVAFVPWLWLVIAGGLTVVSLGAGLPAVWVISRRDPVPVLRGGQ